LIAFSPRSEIGRDRLRRLIGLGPRYLIDEPDHANAVALLEDADVALITGSWTRVEVSGALVRAARTGRGNEADLLALLDADLSPEGPGRS